MAMSTEEEFPPNVPEDTLQDLLLLARGDFDLVEAALIQALDKKREQAWNILQPKKWIIDIVKAFKYIKERREEIDNVKLREDDSIASK
jgi:hypothetical protein